MAILRKSLYLLPAALLLPLFTSCYENFDPGIKTTPKVCLNALLTADSTFKVSVTRTWRYDSGDPGYDFDINLKDARVTATFPDGETLELQYAEKDKYQPTPIEDPKERGYFCTRAPKAGETVTIRATHQQYGEAEATVTIPLPVEIESVKPRLLNLYKEETAKGLSAKFTLDMSVVFTDQADSVDFYLFGLEHSHGLSKYYDEPDGSVTHGYAYINTYNENLSAEPLFHEHMSVLETIFGESYGYSMFSDRQISGRQYGLHIVAENTSIRINNPKHDPDFDNVLYFDTQLMTISDSYYYYLISVWNHYEGIGGTLGDAGLGDPVWEHSNVSTGAGVVAARNISSRRVYLEPLLK